MITRNSVTVKVPIEGRSLHVPYAYRNGAMNLMLPQLFSCQQAPAVRTAVQLAVAGDLLQRFHLEPVAHRLHFSLLRSQFYEHHSMSWNPGLELAVRGGQIFLPP